MARISRYSPNAVILPTSLNISRQFYIPKSHLPGRPALDDSDYAGFETDTVFNDLFISTSRREVVGIGPPLVNLKQSLLPIKLTVIDGNSHPQAQLTHRYTEHDRVSYHRFKLPESMAGQSSIRVRCEFSDRFEVTRDITASSLSTVNVQFTTLQKNNPVSWIRDWLLYCHGMGVERVLFYDNGSDNRIELDRMLDQLPIDLEVVLIDWPFSYGPVRSYYNQFCQATQNNHAYLYFGQSAWTGHFDVDEYLVSSGPLALSRLLKNCSPYIGLLRFDSYWVPDVGGERSGDILSIRDFPYRECKARGRAHKYLMRSRAHRVAKTHNGKLNWGWLRKSVNVKDWSFLHYRPLTTDWRGGTVRRDIVTLDAKLHEEDTRVRDWFSVNDRLTPAFKNHGGMSSKVCEL